MVRYRHTLLHADRILGAIEVVDPMKGVLNIDALWVKGFPVSRIYRVSDTDELLDALGRLDAGEAVMLMPGSYELGETVVLDKPFTGIIGSWDSELVFGDSVGTGVVLRGHGCFLYGLSISKNTYGGIGVEAYGYGYNVSAQRIVWIRIKGWGTAVRAYQSYGSVIAFNNIKSNYGVSIDASSGVLVAMNTVQSYRQGYGVGVRIFYGGGNTVYGNTLAYHQYGVVVSSSNGNTVTDNYIEGGSVAPSAYIILRSAYGFTPQPPSKHNVIRNNRCVSESVPTNGIVEADGDGNVILDNMVVAENKIVISGASTVYNIW